MSKTENTARLVLVTGGARSGKSSFAERYVAAHGERIAYIATAQIFDDEMRYRVKLHRARRPAAWQTYEAPFDAENAIAEAAKTHDALLFDCLTVYLSNLLCAMTEEEQQDEALTYARVEQAAADLLRAAGDLPADARVIFVTNEVGDGIVPLNHLARLYRDLSGLMNQRIAAAADKVYLVCCGIPVDLKHLKEEF